MAFVSKLVAVGTLGVTLGAQYLYSVLHKATSNGKSISPAILNQLTLPVQDSVLVSLLIYQLSALERFHGSRKYMSFVLYLVSASFMVSLVFRDKQQFGIYPMVFGLLHQYMLCVPSYQISHNNSSITQKSSRLILAGVIFIVSSRKLLLPLLVGSVLSTIYDLNILRLQSILVPKPVVSVLQKLFSSQKQQNSVNGGLRQQVDIPQQVQPQINEGDVETLTSMGFSRDSALKALKDCNGSVNEAANRLLSTSS
ncbi:hypothetical protein MIR68_004423 [Amoeboaphelidium protococcarum]|nr:hypothetical protein MIR68_004423 [Amoeboaphelidium protococcarum]